MLAPFLDLVRFESAQRDLMPSLGAIDDLETFGKWGFFQSRQKVYEFSVPPSSVKNR